MTAVADVLTNICLSIYEKFSIPDDIEALMVIGDEAIGGVSPAIDQDSAVYNDFFTSINGQLFEDEAPEYAVCPYAVYSIPSARDSYTFSEEYTNAGVQLFIYSENMDTSEIKRIYRYAVDLFDECTLIITGSTLVWMKEQNLMTGLEQHITINGTKKVLVYNIDFEVLTSLK